MEWAGGRKNVVPLHSVVQAVDFEKWIQSL